MIIKVCEFLLKADVHIGILSSVPLCPVFPSHEFSFLVISVHIKKVDPHLLLLCPEVQDD